MQVAEELRLKPRPKGLPADFLPLILPGFWVGKPISLSLPRRARGTK